MKRIFLRPKKSEKNRNYVQKEIMYQNTIYICISWNSKIWLFSVKKKLCQQNLISVSRDSYIFWIFFT